MVHPRNPIPRRPKQLVPPSCLPSSAGTANSQQWVMRVQVLLVMGQHLLSKEEAGELLDQRVYVVTKYQELRHSMKNFVKLAEYYLEEESLLCCSMSKLPRHVDRFKRQ